MHKLIELQTSFQKNIFKKQAEDLSFIASNFPQERFDIYRQTIFENMLNALRITYPGIWTLLGEHCADNVAYLFCETDAYLPKTGCLDDFGEPFPEFLSTLEALCALPYLKDYAHYEWLKHKAYNASCAKCISNLELQNIPEDKIDNLCFNFIPSCFLFKSNYPISDIYDITQNNTNELSLKLEPIYGIIARLKTEIHTYWITPENWIFFEKLKNKNTLSHSFQYTQTIHNEFDLTSAISFLLQAELIDNFFYIEDKNAKHDHR